MSSKGSIYTESNADHHPLWPYEMYRDLIKSDKMADIAQFLSDIRKPENLDPAKLLFHPSGGGDYNSLVIHEDLKAFLIKLYNEGNALADVLGTEAVKSISGVSNEGEVQTVLKPFVERAKGRGDSKDVLRDYVSSHFIVGFIQAMKQSVALQYAKDSGLIQDDEYEAQKAKINESLDFIGLNGIHRMMEANPEIKNFLEKDTTPIVVEYAKGQEVTLAPLNRYTRSAYISSEKEHYGALDEISQKLGEDVAENKKATDLQIFARAMGREYNKAYEDRVGYAQASMKQIYSGYDELKTPIHEVEANMKSAVAAQNLFELKKWKRVARINYGSALQDIAMKLAQEQADPSVTVTEPKDSLARLMISAPNTDQVVDPPAEGGVDDKKKVGLDTSGTEPAQPQGRSSREYHGSGGYSHPVENKPNTDGSEKDYKGWVTAGKVGIGVVSALAIADGARKIAKNKDEGGDKKSSPDDDKNSTAIQALKVAAGAAGIVLVFVVGPDKIVNTMKQWFGRGK